MAHEVRGSAVLAPRLDDDRRVLRHPDGVALEVDPVTHRCSHFVLRSLLPPPSLALLDGDRKIPVRER
jgi:hypothetical protein